MKHLMPMERVLWEMREYSRMGNTPHAGKIEVWSDSIENILKNIDTFWKKCVEKGIVVVPVRVYSDYRNEDYHEDDYIGIKYVALENGETTVLTDPWVYIDSMSTVLHDTPEEALAAGYKRSAA